MINKIEIINEYFTIIDTIRNMTKNTQSDGIGLWYSLGFVDSIYNLTQRLITDYESNQLNDNNMNQLDNLIDEFNRPANLTGLLELNPIVSLNPIEWSDDKFNYIERYRFHRINLKTPLDLDNTHFIVSNIIRSILLKTYRSDRMFDMRLVSHLKSNSIIIIDKLSDNYEKFKLMVKGIIHELSGNNIKSIIVDGNIIPVLNLYNISDGDIIICEKDSINCVIPLNFQDYTIYDNEIEVIRRFNIKCNLRKIKRYDIDIGYKLNRTPNFNRGEYE